MGRCRFHWWHDYLLFFLSSFFFLYASSTYNALPWAVWDPAWLVWNILNSPCLFLSSYMWVTKASRSCTKNFIRGSRIPAVQRLAGTYVATPGRDRGKRPNWMHGERETRLGLIKKYIYVSMYDNRYQSWK